MRLKLRTVNERSELIAYQRPDATGAKTSDYEITPVAEPEALARTLKKALGSIGVVRKVRRLVLIGQTRVHFDEVDGLGRYLELEVVLRDEQGEEDGDRIATELRGLLDVRDDDLVEGAYFDLLVR